MNFFAIFGLFIRFESSNVSALSPRKRPARIGLRIQKNATNTTKDPPGIIQGLATQDINTN